MALRTTEPEWEEFLEDAGIPGKEAKTYAKACMDNRNTCPTDLSKDILKELGISIIGDILAITKHAQADEDSKQDGRMACEQLKATAKTKSTAKPPQVKAEMTKPEYRKFLVDWTVYKSLAGLSSSHVAPHLYNACDNDVQTAIINTSKDFLQLREADMLAIIETIVTRRSNPAVHRVAFGNLTQ